MKRDNSPNELHLPIALKSLEDDHAIVQSYGALPSQHHDTRALTLLELLYIDMIDALHTWGACYDEAIQGVKVQERWTEYLHKWLEQYDLTDHLSFENANNRKADSYSQQTEADALELRQRLAWRVWHFRTKLGDLLGPMDIYPWIEGHVQRKHRRAA